jgi:hypothetical protein
MCLSPILLRFTLFALCLIVAAPAAGKGRIKRALSCTARLAARPFQTRPARVVGAGIKKVWASKPVRMVVRADTTILNQIDKACVKKRQHDGKRFDKAVLKNKAQVPEEIRVSRRSSTRLERKQIQRLIKAARPLFAGLDLTDVKITNPTTGERRQLTAPDVENALQMLVTASKSLRDHTLLTRGKGLSLTKILANEQVAAAVLAQEKPTDRAEFLRRYRAAISTTQALSQAYELFLHWGGVQKNPRLAKLSRRLNVGQDTLLLVAARVQTPRPVIAAAKALTDDHLKGVTRLWLDPVMQGKPGAERRLRHKLPNKAAARQLLDLLAAYRDGGAVKVIALTRGQRDPKLERRVHKELQTMTSAVAHQALKTDFYKEASKGTREAFMPIILSAAAVGYAVEGAAQLTNSPLFHRIQPTVTGGIDDVGGALVNLKEMKDNKNTSNRGASKDAMCAAGFGLLTSVLLSVSLPGSQAVSQVMLNPQSATMARVGASALYGGASSGGTAYMSTVSARHYYKAVMGAVQQGLIEPPKDRRGRPLKGRRLKAWAMKQSLNEHLSYSAQKWGLVGVGSSAVFTGACGLFPGWGGPAVAPILLGLGGAGETIATGVGLAADPHFGRKKARKTARKLVSH